MKRLNECLRITIWLLLFVSVSCDVGSIRKPEDKARVKILSLDQAIRAYIYKNGIPNELRKENIQELYLRLLSQGLMLEMHNGVNDPTTDHGLLNIVYLKNNMGYILYSTNNYINAENAIKEIKSASDQKGLEEKIAKYASPNLDYLTLRKKNDADIVRGSGLIIVWGKLISPDAEHKVTLTTSTTLRHR